jgi:hypothetical protein
MEVDKVLFLGRLIDALFLHAVAVLPTILPLICPCLFARNNLQTVLPIHSLFHLR